MGNISDIQNKEEFLKEYRVGAHRLGKGGFGKVYPVWDKDYREIFAAIKYIENIKKTTSEVRILFIILDMF